MSARRNKSERPLTPAERTQEQRGIEDSAAMNLEGGEQYIARVYKRRYRELLKALGWDRDELLAYDHDFGFDTLPETNPPKILKLAETVKVLDLPKAGAK